MFVLCIHARDEPWDGRRILRQYWLRKGKYELAFRRFGLEAQRFLTNLARERFWELRWKRVLSQFINEIRQLGCRQGGTPPHATHTVPPSRPRNTRYHAQLMNASQSTPAIAFFALIKKIQLSNTMAEAPCTATTCSPGCTYRNIRALHTPVGLSRSTHIAALSPLHTKYMSVLPLYANTHTCNTENWIQIATLVWNLFLCLSIPHQKAEIKPLILSLCPALEGTNQPCCSICPSEPKELSLTDVPHLHLHLLQHTCS